MEFAVVILLDWMAHMERAIERANTEGNLLL